MELKLVYIFCQCRCIWMEKKLQRNLRWKLNKKKGKGVLDG